MGYWPTTRQGASFAGDGDLITGDAQADAMGEAVDRAREAFRIAMRREMSRAELRATLEFVIRADDTIPEEPGVRGELLTPQGKINAAARGIILHDDLA